MVHVESRRARRVIARVDGGVALHEAVAELARWEKADAALVRGRGVVEAAVLARWDATAGARVERARVEGPVELVTLEGSVALRDGAVDVRLSAVLAGEDGAALAGLLVTARAVAVELALDVLDDVFLDRSPDATGLEPWRPSPRR
jgi:predicted DNA-binding protein with PD1-like motif